MKKTVLSIVMAITALAIQANAQVGINTSSPTATLDLTAKNPTGATTNVDGVLIPRVDRQRAQSMVAVPTSTLIYVNDASTGLQTGIAINIDSVGYYYYNGSAWAKLSPPISPSSFVNIYNTDGSLTGNRIVTQAGNTLAFTGTATNAFSVDGSTLSVDAANDRIGIGTTAPTVKLDMVGTTFGIKNSAGSGSWDNLWFNVTPSIPSINASGAESGLQFNVGSNSVGTYGDGQTLNTVATMLANGNVGLGTTTPHAPLQLANTTANRKIVMYETANNDHEFYGFGVNGGIMRYQADRTTTDHVFYAGVTGGASSNELMRIQGIGNVGIGTSAPAAKFHVEGAEIRLTNATSLWGLDPEGTAPNSQFSLIDRTNNVRRFILQQNGNAYLGGNLGTAGANATISAVGGSVGIGANTSPTNTLDVNGTARVRTITPVSGSTVITPVYADANGVLVKASPSITYGSLSSSTVTVASGATGTLITGVAQGVYKAAVIVFNGCNDVATAEYYLHNFSLNGFFGLRGQNGFLTSNYSSPTFNQTARANIATTWGTASTCQDGGNGTALNYTLSMAAAGAISITNNGNVSRTYQITLVRVD